MIGFMKAIATLGGLGAGAGTYVTAAIAVLTGALGLLTEIEPILNSGNFGIASVGILFTTLVNSGHWAMILGGLGIGRVRKAIDDGATE